VGRRAVALVLDLRAAAVAAGRAAAGAAGCIVGLPGAAGGGRGGGVRGTVLLPAAQRGEFPDIQLCALNPTRAML